MQPENQQPQQTPQVAQPAPGNPRYISGPGIIENKPTQLPRYKSENIVYIAVFDSAICLYDVDGKFIENLTNSNAHFEATGSSFFMLKISTDSNERYFLPNINYNKETKTISSPGRSVAGMGIKQAYGKLEVENIVQLASELSNQNAAFEAPHQINVVDYRALAATSGKKLLIMTAVFGAIGLVLLLIPSGRLVGLVSLLFALGSFIGFRTSR